MRMQLLLTALLLGVPFADGRAQCFETRIVEPVGHFDDRFGTVVLAHEDVLFVTEVGPEAAGRVHVFREQPQGWVQVDSFVPLAGRPGLRFGDALAADGDVLLVGSREEGDILPTGQGGAWIFVRDRRNTATPLDDRWWELQELQPSGVSMPHNFGVAVALNGDTAAVGAPDLPGGDAAVFVFTRTDGGTATPRDDLWVQQARLEPDPSTPDSDLGEAVALLDDGHLVLASDPGDAVGVPGGILTFVRDTQGTPDPADDTWQPGPQIEAPSAEQGELRRQFIVAGERLFAEALAVDPVTFEVIERVAIFERDAAGWTLAQMLENPLFVFGPFGRRMAADTETFVSGHMQWTFGPPFAGAWTVIFERHGNTWEFVQALQAPDESTQDGFGRGVSLHERRLFLGAPGAPYVDDDPAVEGSVHVVELDQPNAWTKLSDSALPAPSLAGWGCLEDDTRVIVRVHDSFLARQPALLVVGASLLDQPLLGSVLFPQPDLLLPLVLGPNGDATLTGRWPSGLPAGTSLWLQAWVPPVPGGTNWEQTHGLRASSPGK